MLTRPPRIFRIVSGLAFVAAAAALTVAACELNPQPLPPGEQGSFTNGDSGAPAPIVNGGGGEDSGGENLSSDAGTGFGSPDGSDEDASDAIAPDASDAGDAGEQDASDGATDASDAAADANQDAE